ncbi:hypothetical protein COL26b_004947 [Colletotrichum chrysophilum]|uniref:uncharacterized protein n=1 Tax=Colletotrichum chrysophilum TaxID=1836956 RepID=UPI002300AEE9|nr:uncharacterized protein COL26b_004947 [Colletotrichum chrysophilum]KAJ0376891.1 hypothetical protein COL26b_004947 [Colletotrichum chrysophilum]
MDVLKNNIVVEVQPVDVQPVEIDTRDDSPETAFGRAIRQFFGSLPERHRNDPGNPFLKELAAIDLSKQSAPLALDGTSYAQESMQSLTACIGTLDEKRKKKRGHHLMLKIAPFLQRFERVSKVLEPLGQAGPMGTGVIFSGTRIVLELAIGFHEYFEDLVDALADIADYFIVYEMYGKTFHDLPEFQDQLVRSYTTIINFWYIASKRLLKTSLRMMDPFASLGEEMTQAKAALEKNSNAIHKLAAAHHVFRSHQNRQQQQKDGIHQWILGEQAEQIDVLDDVNVRLTARHPGTCEWIFEDSRFIEWRDSKKKAVLWYNAQAGSGKSVLTSAIIDHLKQRGGKIACFFFSFNDDLRKHGIHAFRSLIIQLFDLLSPNLTDHFVQLCLEEKLKDYTQKRALTKISVATKLVHELVKTLEVFVVVDGLDECIDMDLPSNEQPGKLRHDMLEDLVKMVQQRSYGIDRWLFTSRKGHSRIRRAMEQLNAVEIQADPAVIARDIESYLNDRTHQYRLLDPGTDDSFLYATFLCHTLNSGQCLAGIIKELRSFPSGLNGYFNRSLEKIAEHEEWKQEFARHLFLLLVTSHQSLTFDEVVDALSVDQESTRSNKHNVQRNARELIEDLCGPLVKCDPVVKFSHKSVQDYFQQDPKRDRNISERIHMFFVHDSDAANTELGLDCLTYLMYDRYEQFQDIDNLLESRSKEHSFLRYASTFWFQHLFSIQPDAAVRQRVERFLKSKAFWTCLSVQSRVAPFLFGFYAHRETGSFQMDIRGHTYIRGDQFGVPLPGWLDGPSKYLDQSFWCFVREWREVLVTCPAGLKYCYPLRSFPEGKSCYLTPLQEAEASDSETSNQLQVKVANLEEVPSLGCMVGMFAFDLHFRTGASTR